MGYAGLKRHVAVALGSRVTVADLPEKVMAVLQDTLEDEESLVREHAARAVDCPRERKR